ncbi:MULTISPECIES: RyR domain-containing protein [Bacteroides]|uniref:RyR domain-containing protein n=1 Tax=Bacteroides TaxID=816 RepID=UPI0018A07BA2|nr:RyR domain-containing protein [Bacteroides finegoldii]
MEKYIPSPLNTEGIVLSEELLELTEFMARNVHEVWAATRMAQGWVYGKERNDTLKEHPCLVPYEELPESEKKYDRDTAIETLKLIKSLNYEIHKV